MVDRLVREWKVCVYNSELARLSLEVLPATTVNHGGEGREHIGQLSKVVVTASTTVTTRYHMNTMTRLRSVPHMWVESVLFTLASHLCYPEIHNHATHLVSYM